MRLFLLITTLAQTACPRYILLSAIAAAAANAGRAASEGRRTSARAREAYDFPVKPLFDDESCPSVYIYDHAAFWPVNASLDAVAALSADDVFGPRCSEAIPEERPTGQFEMAHIVVWRLTRPPRPSLHACRRTTDPALADLFLVPTFPGGKHIRDWARACAGETDGLASSLTYLDARTAHRHVFLVSKGAPQRRATGVFFRVNFA